MDTLTLPSFRLALLVAYLRMPALDIYRVNAWNLGIVRGEPWRTRTSSLVRSAAQGIQAWLSRLWSPRVAFACLAVLLAIMLAQHGAGPGGMLLAIVPAVAAPVPVNILTIARRGLLAEAEALKSADGTFADDAKRAAFDAKMTEVEAIDAQIRTAEAAPAPTQVPADLAARAQADERARMTGIQAAVQIAKRTTPGLFATPADEQAFDREFVLGGKSLDEARSAIFARMAAKSDENPTNPRFALGEDARAKAARGAENWLIVRSGMADTVAKHDKVDVRTIDPGEFRGMSLLDLARFSLERAGHPSIPRDKQRLVAEAMTYRASITQSTSDFAVLLENTLNKVLQAAYAMQANTWRRFCNIGSVADFRANNRYRMGSFAALDTVNENGEFKNKSIPDGEKATITAITKGNIINVSRQMIVNDDMNAFARLPQMLGWAAALSIETDVYALLAQNAGLGPTMLDGLTLFHATHLNITTGAALSTTAIDADRVAMASQKDVSSNLFLDLRPEVLLVPVGLGGLARIINQSQYDTDTVANKPYTMPNRVVGLFSDIVDTPRITGTRRYLFANAALAPVIEVAFLEGQQAPVLETMDGWRVDGAEMKVRLDYGVAAVDFRGAITNAGV